MKPLNAVRAVKPRPLAVVTMWITVATIVNALVVGCGGKSDQSAGENNAQAPSSTSTATPAPAAGDLGAQVYATRCVTCHGPNGKGDGPAAAALNPKPRNHTDGAYMNSRTDDQLLEVIRNGKGGMPAWGKILSDEEIHAVLKHVRSLAVPPYPGTPTHS